MSAECACLHLPPPPPPIHGEVSKTSAGGLSASTDVLLFSQLRRFVHCIGNRFYLFARYVSTTRKMLSVTFHHIFTNMMLYKNT
jgi:hypothetical protein